MSTSSNKNNTLRKTTEYYIDNDDDGGDDDHERSIDNTTPLVKVINHYSPDQLAQLMTQTRDTFEGKCKKLGNFKITSINIVTSSKFGVAHRVCVNDLQAQNAAKLYADLVKIYPTINMEVISSTAYNYTLPLKEYRRMGATKMTKSKFGAILLLLCIVFFILRFFMVWYNNNPTAMTDWGVFIYNSTKDVVYTVYVNRFMYYEAIINYEVLGNVTLKTVFSL
jgi:hypothetical protein